MSEPGLALRFWVSIDDYGTLGSWTKCEGLAVEYEVFEYPEGGVNDHVHRLPGRRKYPNVKLTRPLDEHSADVVKWISGMALKVKRRHAEIAVFDPNDKIVCRWNLTSVYPVKWTGPSLDAGGNQIANETLELSHDGFLSPGV
jgi:phage tail-like protein